MRKFDRQRRPSLWLAIPIVMVLMLVWTNTDYPVDYWLHINNGQWMVDHGSLIQHDTFTHTIEGESVKNQPWLAQLVMHRLHLIGGYQMNQFVAGLGYAFGVAALMWLIACRCGNWTLASMGGCLTVALMATNLGVRPQLFSVVLFAVELVLLMRVRRTAWVALGCIIVTSFWTNMHGAFPLGAVLPGIFFAGAMIRWLIHSPGANKQQATHFGVVTLVSAVGCFARPFPGDAIGYVTNCSSRAVERGLVEWLPTSLATESGPMFFASLGVLICVLCFANRSLDLRNVMLLGAFLFLACSSQRMVLWWAFVMPLVIARPADQLWRQSKRWIHGADFPRKASAVATKPKRRSPMDRVMATVMGVLVGGFIVFSTPWSRTANACLPSAKRVSIPNGEPFYLVQQLVDDSLQDTDATQRTFAPLSWGSYITWYSDGRLQSFIDTRVDFFPDEIWAAYQEIAHGGANALDMLDDYGVQWVVCDIRQERLIAKLNQSPEWDVVCQDDVGMVFSSTSNTQP